MSRRPSPTASPTVRPRPVTRSQVAWPSRRRMITMLAAALGGALVAPYLPRPDRAEAPPSRWTGKTRWIGHC
jgi:hypothetical protein